jgi:SAM-dependent methyltransferase
VPVVAVDPYGSRLGRFYAFYIEHPVLARLVGKLGWGTTFEALYRSLRGLRDLPASLTILDACCGAGLALHWLDPSIRRYIGVDSSPAMLDRARQTAARRGFSGVELQLADVEAIPLPDGAADVALLYNALHAVPDPQAAVREVARCLKPNGQLLGTMIARGQRRRADRFIEHEIASLMGPSGTVPDLEQWLTPNFSDLDLSLDGALVSFHAHRSEPAPAST